MGRSAPVSITHPFNIILETSHNGVPPPRWRYVARPHHKGIHRNSLDLSTTQRHAELALFPPHPTKRPVDRVGA